MSCDYTIRPERPEDAEAISKVHDLAFGPDEPIALLVKRLRTLRAPYPTLSFVACADSGGLLGHVMLSHSWLDAPERLVDVFVLSPLGVMPKAQGQGIGTALVAHAIAEAKQTPAPILFLEGDPAFYATRGFEPSKPFGIRAPSLRIPEPALQMVRLPSYDPQMRGSLVYRDLWW
ncbi:MAG: GNAT family N-acetyltransferase, partial [Paracoccaceae bacterium]